MFAAATRIEFLTVLWQLRGRDFHFPFGSQKSLWAGSGRKSILIIEPMIEDCYGNLR